MKVLFCLPSQTVGQEGVNDRPTISIPLGVLSIASFLRENGWSGEIDVYDARLSGKVQRQQGPHGPETLFGDTDEETAARLRAAKADVIGISNMFTAQFPQALRMAEIARRVCPNATIVMGGPHVSAFPAEALNHPAIDFVVMGEGEERMLALLQCLESGEYPQLQGILGRPEDETLLRKNKRVRIGFINDFDRLPIPAYELVDMDRYFELQAAGYSPWTREWGKRVASIITSRGCPHQCIFCSIHATMGYKWRPHTVDYVRRYVQFMVDRYRIDYIHFEDDNLTHSPERFDGIAEIMQTFDPRIPWDTPNGVRGDTWTLERVRRAKDAGCQSLTVAIESAVQEVLDKIVKKRLDLSQVDELMRSCREVGLRLQAFYVIGFPGETLEQIRTTCDFALKRYLRYGVWPGMSLATPLPGTELHEIVVEKGYHPGEVTHRSNEIVTPDFDPATLNRELRRFTRLKLLIFLWRTLTCRADFKHNVKWVWHYRQAALRQLRHAFLGERRTRPVPTAAPDAAAGD